MKSHRRVTINSRDLLWIVYCLIYVLITLVPALKYRISYLIAGSFGLAGIVIFYVYEYRYRKLIVLIFGLSVFSATLCWITGNSGVNDIINTPINYLRFLLPAFLLFNICKMPRNGQLFVHLFSSAVLAYVLIKTLIAVNVNPMIARLLASGSRSEDLMLFRFSNIGGLEACYAIGLTFSAWITLAFDSKGMVGKLVFASLAVISFYFVLAVQFMLLLLLCFIALLLAFLYRSGSRIKKVLGVTAAILLALYLSDLLLLIANSGVSPQLYSKLVNMSAFLSGQTSIETTSSRIDLYRDAFLEFLESPLFGKINSQSAPTAHSTFLGIAATTGIIGLLIYGFFIKSCYMIVSDQLLKSNVSLRAYRITFISFIVLLLLNPIGYAYEISFVVLLYIPLTLMFFDNQNFPAQGKVAESDVMEHAATE